jgi:hypothetical protein
MKHVHHDMIVAWAKDTSRVVEIRGVDWAWRETVAPTWGTQNEYRFKPAEPKKYIVVNGVNVPEPVREPLRDGQEYWVASTGFTEARIYSWYDSVSEIRWLSLGLIHLTREAAQAHIDAMLLPSRSDQ